MRFDQGFLLWALPLMALPILIHLINQNRHKTINWAATMFLLQARKMARGMARLKYLLLMLARMLAIAALIFAMSRPWVGGWLGALSGDEAEVTIFVLDRSASMEEQNAQTGVSKRSRGLQQLQELVENTNRNSRVVLFDSVTRKPLEITSIEALQDLPDAQPSDTNADIPGLLLDVADYITDNKLGRTDVWICSDERTSDWSPADGRWESIQKSLGDREGVVLRLLSYEKSAEDNITVTVSGVHRRESLDGAELVMDIRLDRATPTEDPIPIEVSVIIDGVRSRLTLPLTGSQAQKTGFAIPLDKDAKTGWGRVEIPRDSNDRDNVYNFVYSEPPIQKSVIVSDDPTAAELFRVATATPADNSLIYEAQVLPSSSASAIPWSDAALIVWHAPLPTDTTAAQLNDFIFSGKSVLFFPPDQPDNTEFLTASWADWKTAEAGEFFRYAPWRNDADLLANTRSGSSLEVGEVQCYRMCGLNVEDAVTLWQTENNQPLLTRIPTDQGAAWFCSTLPTPANSNMVTTGVTYYIMMQRALARGAAGLGTAQILEAGNVGGTGADWKPLDGPSQEVSESQRTTTAGLYMTENRWLALNRPSQEDRPDTVNEDAISKMLSGVDYVRINDSIDSEDSLLSEIWRAFLVTMIIALIAEALLCVPEKSESTHEVAVEAS